MNRLIIIYLLLLILFCQTAAKAQDVFTRVQVSPKNVYVGQPCKYTIKVYTDTWFTKGAVFQPFSLNEAFLVPGNNQVGSIVIKGKTYSYVEYHYWIYPYNAGVVKFPQQKIVVNSPALGEYKAVPRTILARPTELTVSPNPPQIKADDWLVAQNLSRTQTWSQSTNNIKVGEVVERTIKVKAFGTMASFMPTIEWDAPENISVYPQAADIKTETPERSSAIIAKQEQTVAYLFEKEGSYTLPAVDLGYWNVRQHRWIDKSLPEITINVAPNPDLSILASHKDSLSQVAPVDLPPSSIEKETFNWSDLLIWIGYLLLAIITIWLLSKAYKVLESINERRKQTEYYAFNRLIKAIKSNTNYYDCLYGWLNKVSSGSSKSLDDMVYKTKSASILKDFQNNNIYLLGNKRNASSCISFYKRLRKSLLKKGEQNKVGLNP